MIKIRQGQGGREGLPVQDYKGPWVCLSGPQVCGDSSQEMGVRGWCG